MIFWNYVTLFFETIKSEKELARLEKKLGVERLELDQLKQINHRNQVNTISDFENETPTRMSATHTISQIERKSQNGILKDVSILGTFHWVNSTFLK